MAARSADSLSEYRRRRDFAKTSEPSGRQARKKGWSFVVQKHDARRLHYDFRLELDGVLKSWAVTRGPSFDPSDKRLAVRTEDHPLEYGGFEGTITKGEYGGGTVMLWDQGTWEPIDDPHEGLKKGKLAFRLNGERMKGGWALIRMRPRDRKEKRENWLLIKDRDSEADGHDLDSDTTSIASGRTMQAIAKGSNVWHSNRKKLGSATAKRAKPGKAGALPDFRPPQLATLTTEPPDGDDWLHELKYDGYRLLIAASGSKVRCYTRSGQDWSAKFPAIVEAFAAMDLDGAMIDGEAVAYADGRSDFSALQKALSEGGRIEFYAFDLLEDAGEDLRRKPLTERKERLESLLADLPKSSPIHLSTHIEGRGSEVFAGVCKAGEEGIVSKKASAPYRSQRTKTWLKVKCTRRQEFVIGGWTPSEKRTGFRSLLLGAFEDGRLRYVGRVGTGFDQKLLQSLGKTLKSLARDKPAFVDVPREARRNAKWVEPKLVAEIAYTEFTDDGILRHPAFLGLREDKKAREVAVERAKPVEEVTREKVMQEGAPRGTGETRAGVRITSPGKVLFPDQGLSKGDLIDYYEAVAELMLPHLTGRPLSLVRCPQGRAKKCFFQKHDSGGFPAELKRIEIEEGTGASGQYFYVDDLEGIVAGVQMGVLEFHIWGSRVDRLEKPDRIVFDLDPDVGLDFGAVRAAALDVRGRLADIGLETFPMLSGGKGFHVIAPLERRMEWPEVKSFCRAFAVKLAEDAPDRYVANMAKAKRKGCIFLDYLRNERGATSIAPYSTRARANAPVATPISWDEVETVKAANGVTVETMPERAKEVGDPWRGYFDVRQSITKGMLAAVA